MFESAYDAAKISKEIHKEIQNYQLKKDDIVITIVGTIGEVGILEKEVIPSIEFNNDKRRMDDEDQSKTHD